MMTTGLRATAAALGFSRKRLIRLLRDGLPAVRRGESVSVDIEAAKAWIEEREAEESPAERKAPILDSRDPRYRERTAAFEVKTFKHRVALGLELECEAAESQLAGELVAFKSSLCNMVARLGATIEGKSADEVAAMVAAEVEEALALLTLDSQPMPAEEEPRAEEEPDEDDDSAFDIDGPPIVPRLMSGDPRHAFAIASANAREHELAELRASHVPASLFVGHIVRVYSEICDVAGALGFDVGSRLADKRNSYDDAADTINEVVRGALTDLSEMYGERERAGGRDVAEGVAPADG